MDAALAAFAASRGLDASGVVDYVDVDALSDSERAAAGVSMVPHIVARNEAGGLLFNYAGRITQDQAVDLLGRAACRVAMPAATPAAPAAPAADEFPASAPSAPAVFYRSYARRTPSGSRETFAEAVSRSISGLAEVGDLTAEQSATLRDEALALRVLPSGRWLWVGGTEWIANPHNYSGSFNCTSTTVDAPETFGLMMALAMMGSGTGAILERHHIAKLPPISRRIALGPVAPIGTRQTPGRAETVLTVGPADLAVSVGDSRDGWVSAYQAIIDAAMSAPYQAPEEGAPSPVVAVTVDLSEVRGAGAPLAGFGGKANPVRLPVLFERMAAILNGAYGRNLSPLECCLLIDEGAACVVAGNIRRSAGMRQFSADDVEASRSKLGLYTQAEDGSWRVDPAREALRMANHTRVFHSRPSLEEVTEAVALQFQSGEGAIQYAPEAIARASADLFPTAASRAAFVARYEAGQGEAAILEAISKRGLIADGAEVAHRLTRYGLNPCGEIIGADFHCNLSEVHLNRLVGASSEEQDRAFAAAGLEVGALLRRGFDVPRYQTSREIDPIVGVSFTGLFDFFVHTLGVRWLEWFAAGRPWTSEGRRFVRKESNYLSRWRRAVEASVADYCKAHGLKVPNRCTTVQPAGTKSLLTGASSGWHPPKAARFLRRITFGAHDPVALAMRDAGYSITPSPSCRDESGALLDDVEDPRVTEWLVEVPTAVTWADLPGADAIDLAGLPAVAQFRFYMNVQKHYTAHNTSATIELRENEVESLAAAIHRAMGKGYISAALLARFDVDGGTFPRLPFEPITRFRYDAEMLAVSARRVRSFTAALADYDGAAAVELQGPAGCDSSACLLAASDKDADQSGKL
jgi:ribonucleotide reductase class II